MSHATLSKQTPPMSEKNVASTETSAETDKVLKILCLSGSLRRKSHTKAAVDVVAQSCQKLGAAVYHIDLAALQLPFCEDADIFDPLPFEPIHKIEKIEKIHEIEQPNVEQPQAHTESRDAVQALRSIVQDADGLIIGTPEYHNSFSGVLKNALDLLSIQQLRGKSVALVGVSGGVMGGSKALMSLGDIMRSLYCYVIPEQLMVSKIDSVWDEKGRFKDPGLTQRAEQVAESLVRMLRAASGMTAL